MSPVLVGRRIMVRYATADGRLTDAVGDLLAWRDGSLRVRTRSGIVDVAESAVVAGQPVPEPTLRHAADVSVAQLHRITARGWRPLETAWVGGWLLRASGGFTRRANSVLPLGAPDRPLDGALDAVVAWYAERGLAARFQCPDPDVDAAELADPPDQPLDEALAARGWEVGNGAVVVVADTADVLSRGSDPADSAAAARLDAAPAPEWVAAYHYGGQPVPAAGLAVLTNHPRAVFASVPSPDGGPPLAIARGAVDGDWVGLTAIEVAPAARRRGLGRLITTAAVGWGADQGARHAYAQVDARNAGALAMYAALGFTTRSGYHYRLAPERVEARPPAAC